MPKDVTIGRIGECLREVGDYGAGRGVEIWMEVTAWKHRTTRIAADYESDAA